MAMAEDRQMLVVNVADGKSVSFSPLPETFGEGLFSERSRGEFVGIFLDEGELFIAGADAHVWRLPFASIKGTLDWPVRAFACYAAIADQPDARTTPKRHRRRAERALASRNS